MFIRLSLLTMTNLNQMLKVLLSVYSKMADESDHSSEPPVPDRKQERSEEESSIGDAFALLFRREHFCSVSLIPFALYSSAPLFMRPRHFAWSCAICSRGSVGMLKSLREALRMSLYRFFWPPWERFPSCSSPYRIFFGKRSSGIVVAWSVYLNCANFRKVSTLCIPAFSGLLCLESYLATWSLEIF